MLGISVAERRHLIALDFSLRSPSPAPTQGESTALLSRMLPCFIIKIFRRACPGRGYRWQLPNYLRTELFFPESPPAIPEKNTRAFSGLM